MHVSCPSECPEFVQQLGACNKNKHNQYRKVMNRFDKHCDLPGTYQAYLTGWDVKSGQQRKISVSFSSPHELLNHYVSEENISDWSSFSAEQQNLKDTLGFWGERVGVRALEERFLSLGVWGDAAPYAHRDTVYLMLWNVVTGKKHKRFWFASFPKMCSGFWRARSLNKIGRSMISVSRMKQLFL